MKNIKNLGKRAFTLFLTVVMCLGMVNLSAFAAEAPAHEHNEGGWQCVQAEGTRQLVCEMPEHTHGEECRTAGEPVLTCGEDEAEGHTHGADCRGEAPLTCEDESEEHEHTEDCYGEAPLICGKEETEGHAHGEECYTAGEPVLVCEETEHTHTEECYTVTEGAWTCTAPVAETPAEVQAFLDAVAALPDASEVTADNAEAVGEQVNAVIDLWDAMDEELSAREDVTAAMETVYAVYEAVLAAAEVDNGSFYEVGTSELVKSAFENAYNLGQSDTCVGIVTLNGVDSVTDSGTPNVWPTGNWEGAVNVTGYNWVNVINTNPDVASVSYKTEGGKLLITFTPGTSAGTTYISVGVDAKYPHYSLGTWNMELNFDYKVTNINGTPAGAAEYSSISRSVVYDLSTGTATWGKEPYDNQYGVRTTASSSCIFDFKDPWGYWYSFYPTKVTNISVGSYDTSIAAVETWGFTTTEAWSNRDDDNNTTHAWTGFSVTGLEAGETYVDIRTEYDVQSIKWNNYGTVWSVDDNRAVTTRLYIKVIGEAPETEYVLTYDANGGTVENLESWSDKRVSTADSMDFTIYDAVPTRTGYTFKGWADTSDATTAQYQKDDTLTLDKTNPTKTIYAVWEENSNATVYGVVREYYLNGALVGTVTNVEVAYPGTAGDKVGATKGAEIAAAHSPKWNTYQPTGEAGHTYSYASCNEITLEAGWQNSDKSGENYLYSSANMASTARTNLLVMRYEYNDPTRTYTVTYTDGVPGEIVFADQNYEDQKAGGETPKFKVNGVEADPTREGYTFMGWSPAVNPEVDPEDAKDGKIVYTATWKKNQTPTPTQPDPDRTGINLVKKVNGKDSEALTVDNRGEELIYTITVTNNTNVELANMLIRDRMPEGVTLKEGSGSATVNGEPRNVTVTETGAYHDWKVEGTVADKAEVVLTYKATVTGEGEVSATNTAKAFAKQYAPTAEAAALGISLLNEIETPEIETPDGYGDQFESNEDDATVTAPATGGTTPVVDDGKGVTITKTRVAINDNPNQTVAETGDTIEWSITVTNNSNVEKTVELTEMDGATLSETKVTVAAGTSETVTAYYTVTGEEMLENGKLYNTVKGTTGGTGDKENPVAKDDGTEIKGTEPEAPTKDDLDTLKLGVQVVCDVTGSGHKATEYKFAEGQFTAGEVTENTGADKDQYPYTCTVSFTVGQQNWYLGLKRIADDKDWTTDNKEGPAWNTDHKLANERVLTATLYYDGTNWTLPTDTTVNPDVKLGTNIGSWSYLVIHTVHIEKPTVTVTYKDAEGAVIGTPETADKGTEFTIQDAPEAPEGKEFDYWSGDDGEKYQPGDKVTPEKDLTLTVVWKDKEGGNTPEDPDETVTVTWLDGYTGAQVGEQKQVKKGTTEVDPSLYPADPTREGYTFKGWGEPVTGADGNITITAQWSENSSNPDPVVPDPVVPNPVVPDPVVYTYVLTINYVDGNGNIVATAYTAQMPAGAAYSVSSPVVEGYTPDRDVVSGTMPAGNVTVTVVYTADEADIEDDNPPLADLPDPGEDIPDADLPKENEEVPVDDEEDITDEDVPLSDVPRTGDHTNRFLVMAAVSGLCLLTLLSGRRKEDEA